MERLTLSDSRGEYCATCFRVLLQLASSWYCRRVCGVWQVHVLVCDAVEGAVVIEAKVARVDDVVCPSICSELVERLQVSCLPSAGPLSVQDPPCLSPRTSAMQSTRTLPC
jgi:hypothetical protein